MHHFPDFLGIAQPQIRRGDSRTVVDKIDPTGQGIHLPWLGRICTHPVWESGQLVRTASDL